MRPHDQPFLTREQEQNASAELLVLSHGRLVAKMAKAFSRYGVSEEDLAQEGNIGLMIAASKFRPDSGNRFSTYAQWWVRAMMMDFVMRNYSVVAASRSSKAKRTFFRQRPFVDLSMDTPIGEGGLTIGDTFVCPDPLPDDVVERALDNEAMLARLKAAISTLGDREADVIRSRFFRDDKETLEAIAVRHGVSKERIRQIETMALKKIKKRVLG